MPVKKGRLKPDEEYKIKKNYEFLRESIDACNIASHLYTSGVLTEFDKLDIDETNSRLKRNEQLIAMILHSGPENSYNSFLKALENDHAQFIIDRLENTPINAEDVKSPYSWFDNLKDSIKTHVLRDSDASRIGYSLGNNWEELMYRLGFSYVEVQREKMKNSDTLCMVYLLIKWRQRVVKKATIQNLIAQLIELEDSSSMTIDWKSLETTIKNIDVS